MDLKLCYLHKKKKKAKQKELKDTYMKQSHDKSWRVKINGFIAMISSSCMQSMKSQLSSKFLIYSVQQNATN